MSALEDIFEARAPAGDVIDDAVVLPAPGAPFVAAFARAHLESTQVVRFPMPRARRGGGDILGEGGPGGGVGGLPRTHLGGPDEAGWRMDQAAAVLVFVAMLAAGARSGKPFDAQIAVIELGASLGPAIDDGDGDRR